MSKQRSILLIDDYDYIIEGTAALLRFEGFTFLAASNGRDGIRLAREHHPDLVICDVSMPEMDGYTVLRHLREDPETASIRFMFLTARAEKSDMRAGMDIGADDYLIKPFSIEELLSAIEAQWKKTDALQRGVEELTLNVTYALPHEFRTALNQILGSAQSLKALQHSDPTLAELADDIITSAKRLFHITENFLVYAQLETLSANRQAFELLSSYRTVEAAATAVDIAMMKADQFQRSADLNIGTVPEGVAVSISNEHFHKVLDELLDNAFKFSSAGLRVQLECHADDQWLTLSIRDEGCGMTPAQINRIGAYKQFNRFVQEQQGIGLGLIIAQRLVELHGGQVDIESAPVGGTLVMVRLPLEHKW